MQPGRNLVFPVASEGLTASVAAALVTGIENAEK